MKRDKAIRTPCSTLQPIGTYSSFLRSPWEETSILLRQFSAKNVISPKDLVGGFIRWEEYYLRVMMKSPVESREDNGMTI
jgi:hypothetical protein